MDSYETFRSNNPGAYTGWGDTEARADYAATHGAGKGTQGGSSSSSSSGSSQQITAPQMTDLENKIFNTLKPYYIQLLQESNGDFQVATQKLADDYKTGVRTAKVAYTTGTTGELANLQNALQTADISNEQGQEKEINDLNQRGMAVSQTGPDNALNVLGVHLPQGDQNPTGPESGINPLYSNPNAANLGEGGRELTQLQQDQQLRQEATQRASNQKLQQLGITYQQATNNPSGYDLTNQAGLASAAADINSGKADLSQFGTEEQKAINDYNTNAEAQRVKNEGLYQNLQQTTGQEAGTLAQANARTSDVNTTNTLNQTAEKDFINSGGTTKTGGA